MKKKSKFLVGLLAAGITFASLVVFVGPKYSHYKSHHYCYSECIKNDQQKVDNSDNINAFKNETNKSK